MIISLFVLLVLFAIGGCNLRSAPTAAPTPQMNATQSYQTAVARVTQFYLETVQASGAGDTAASDTPEPEEPTETATESDASATPAPPTARPTNTPQPCDRAAPGNPIDVTIPDDTEIVIGQGFEKTWRLVNVGTCTWNSQYAVVWISGEQMGNEDIVFLPGSVAPGQSVDIKVLMTAPDDPGSYQSNWKLRNSAGVLFGIGDDADSVFWVRIEAVAPTPTPTITPTPTATTAAATATATPEVQANNSANLVLSDSIDLDGIVVNPGAGQDLSYSLGTGGNHLLTPVNGAQLGVFGQSAPGYASCQLASLSSAAVAVESVGVNTYLCYKTDAGRYGRLQITAFNSGDGALTVQALTWAIP